MTHKEKSGLPDEARHTLALKKGTYKAKPAVAPHGAMAGVVGATGFEPATPWSQTRYATGLRYAPNYR